MASERIEVGVSYDLRRGYYITTTTNVPPIAALMPDTVDVRLVLDRVARLERDRRRALPLQQPR